MTIADKLLEIGLTCPCGGRAEMFDYQENEHSPIVDYIECCDCGASTGVIVDHALTAWLVLTGGPVPEGILPPLCTYVLRFWRDKAAAVAEYKYYNGQYGWWTMHSESMPHIWSSWWWIERNPDTIRKWLSQPWEKENEDV